MDETKIILLRLNRDELRVWGGEQYLALTAREGLAVKQLLEQELAKIEQAIHHAAVLELVPRDQQAEVA